MSDELEPATPEVKPSQTTVPAPTGPARSWWRGMVGTPGRAAAVAVAATLVLAAVPCGVLGAVAGAAIVSEHGGDGGDHGDGHGGRGDREGHDGGTEQEEEQDDKGPTSTVIPSPSTATPTAPASASPSTTP
ncbi:hypothetical protein ACFO1B_12600 [Dactylosporangium siamense]|uniref:Uncharacterized protein n=1 Tax=Dactylosporangium siamense TaxID=685454 RepID=A0A919UFY5_9ACTN|nr:hypothetical protein [Dactylosporangium siamense]GIG49123.1 hypothetical protein Dsi01nite_071640 [Dactylosporangium siamense]